MLWIVAALLIAELGLMALIDAYFEGCSDSNEYIMSLYVEDMYKTDVDVWCNSYRLYLNSRY